MRRGCQQDEPRDLQLRRLGRAGRDFSVHQALAIKDGRILAVGTDDEIRRHVGKRTEVVNLDDKTVIPGLVDNHVHIVRGARQWHLGTDTMMVNQSNPFYTLWWAVSGQAMNGDKLTDETVTREEALLAHTRSNARLAFREKDLGSLEPGKLADLLVLDRDYLSVPQVEIRAIKPLITMVGGEIVYRAQ